MVLLKKASKLFAQSVYYLYKADEEHKFRYLAARLSSWTFYYLMRIYVPVAARKHVYGTFAKNYGVKLHEMRRTINDFKTFNEFFTRQIRPECRPVD